MIEKIGSTLNQSVGFATVKGQEKMHPVLGEFDVIYCDAPWAYAEVPYFKKSLAIQNQYPTLKKEDLYNINVESVAKKDCWLYMWAVWAQLPQALKVIEEWGFSYRTCAFVWAKKTKNGKDAKTYGRCCTQGSTEVVLCAKRGSPKRYAHNVPQFIEAQTRGNSVKPDEIYDRIDKIVDPANTTANSNPARCKGHEKGAKKFNMELCPHFYDGCWCHTVDAPPVRKLELFARRPWPGWYALGNDEEIDDPDNEFCIFGDIRDTIGVKE
jgi:N6-adenosine-specific RNA methylase IME4